MDLKERALAGVLGGVAATLVLSGLREAWTRVGLVFETAPMQVVERMEVAYGMGTGTAFGFLRRERGGPTEEAAVGAALGLLAWDVGWASSGCRLPVSTERPRPSAHPRCCCPRWTTRCSGPRGGLRTGCSVNARGATKKDRGPLCSLQGYRLSDVVD